jgi:DNA polymerase-3 subunit gamma/tau
VVDEDVRDVLGFIPNEILDQTIDALAARDSKSLLNTIEIVIEQGLNIQQYVREFISRVRDLLLMRLDLSAKVIAGAEEKEALKQRAGQFSEQDLIRYFDMMLQLEADLRVTAQPRFHVEVGFIKLAKIGHLRDIEAVINDLRQGGGGVRPSIPVTPAPVTAPPKPASPPVKPVIPTVTKEPGSFKDTFLRRVEDRSATTAVYLQKAERIEQKPDFIEVTVPNSTYLAALETKEHRSVVESVAADLVGKPVSVSFIMKGQQTPSASAEPASTQTIDSAREEPLVKRFLEVFRGDLAQVKPLKGE